MPGIAKLSFCISSVRLLGACRVAGLHGIAGRKGLFAIFNKTALLFFCIYKVPESTVV